MLYSISLFLHISGALGLFTGIGIELAALAGLRRATTSTQVREWTTLLGTLRRIVAPSMVLLLATGIHLAIARRAHEAWLVAGLLGVVAMAGIGRGLIRGRVRAIAQAMTTADSSLSPALRDRIHDPVLHVAAWLRVAFGVGIVFDMTVKPDTPLAVAALAVTLAIGAAVASRNGRRSEAVPT